MPYKYKADQVVASHKHYQLHAAEYKKRAYAFTKVAKLRNKAFVARVKRWFGCAKCNVHEPTCLEFHHIRDKTANVADAVRSAWSIERLKDEIRKCVVLCANCHRLETATSRS